MTREDLINQRATTCRHGGHCEWVACDKCSHYEPKPETITNSTSGYLEVVLPECSDCISRQAVDELSKELVHTTRDKADFLCNFWEGLQKLPPVTPKEKTGWIPVNERLPEEFESVLVCYESQGGMAQAVSERFGTHTGYRWSALAGIEPIAWMPLPEPFKAESETKE